MAGTGEATKEAGERDIYKEGEKNEKKDFVFYGKDKKDDQKKEEANQKPMEE